MIYLKDCRWKADPMGSGFRTIVDLASGKRARVLSSGDLVLPEAKGRFDVFVYNADGLESTHTNLGADDAEEVLNAS